MVIVFDQENKTLKMHKEVTAIAKRSKSLRFLAFNILTWSPVDNGHALLPCPPMTVQIYRWHLGVLRLCVSLSQVGIARRHWRTPSQEVEEKVRKKALPGKQQWATSASNVEIVTKVITSLAASRSYQWPWDYFFCIFTRSLKFCCDLQ